MYEDEDVKSQSLFAYNAALKQWEHTDSITGVRDSTTGNSAAVFKDSVMGDEAA